MSSQLSTDALYNISQLIQIDFKKVILFFTKLLHVCNKYLQQYM